MTTGVVYNPTCSICHKRMGDMTGDEFSALVLAEGLEAKCFECDVEVSGRVPAIFGEWQIGDVFVIGDEALLVEAYFSNGRLSDRLTHAHERARAQICLSSSTNLNESCPNHPAQVGKTTNYAKCPLCGEEVAESHYGGYDCEDCVFYWWGDSSIILPPRPIPGEARYKDCPDCEAERDNYSNRYGERKLVYCAYHHALLIEQQEDGSLGWQHESL